MDKFAKIFFNSLLHEATPQLPPEDEAAFNNALDKNTPPDTFDVQGAGVNNQVDHIETAKHWIMELDTFAKKLNDTTPDSLNTFLNNVDREGSLFRGISKSQSDKIIDIAGSLRDLAEALKGHIIQAPKKQQEMQSQQNI